MAKEESKPDSGFELLEKMRTVFNRKMVLSPQGSDHVLDCQEKLWEVRSELEGVGSLLRSLGGGTEISPEDLFGLGVWLKRLSRRLEKVENRLGRVLEPSDTGTA